MGNSKLKKSTTTTLSIVFENAHRSFNGTEPILANISIKSDEPEPVRAYGLEVTVAQKYRKRYETTDSEGNTTVHFFKDMGWQMSFMAHKFGD